MITTHQLDSLLRKEREEFNEFANLNLNGMMRYVAMMHIEAFIDFRVLLHRQEERFTILVSEIQDSLPEEAQMMVDVLSLIRGNLSWKFVARGHWSVEVDSEAITLSRMPLTKTP